MHDERYTTTEANSILDDIKIPKTERKKQLTLLLPVLF